MLNVCFFIGNLNNSGGTERITSVIANELSKLNYNVSILTLHSGEKPFFPLCKEIKTSQINKKKYKTLFQLPSTIFKLRRYLRKNDIDIIIDVDTMLSIYTIPALFMISNIKHISWEHFNYNVTLGKKIRIPIRNIAAKFSDIIITLTERDKSLWIKHTKGKNIIAIPNPITLQGNIPRLNINKKKCILAVGRLTHQKGFDILIHSWKIVNQQYPDWCLKIIGSGEDEYNLTNLINLLELDNSVEIAPTTYQIEAEYYLSSYLVSSSRYEGFGLVILEAQSCGLPVISFDCDAGPSEIIRNNISGWLCECENINELALKIINAINIFDKNPEFYKELEKNSIINSKRFTVENILPLWTKIL